MSDRTQAASSTRRGDLARRALESAVCRGAAARRTDWSASIAFRWRKRDGRGAIEPVRHVHRIALDDLQGIDDAEAARRAEHAPVRRRASRQQRAADRRARHRQVLAHQGAAQQVRAAKGLRLIEVEKHDLVDLADIVDRIAERPERFVLYCDDLSFEAGEPGYKALKVVLDGSIAAASENCLIYATSNRRHLMPEYMQREPRVQARRRGDPSGRDLRGEDLALRALRAVGVVLSVRPGRLSADRRRSGSSTSRRPARRHARPRTARGAAVGAHARLAQRARRVAVRARLGGQARIKDEGGRRVTSDGNASAQSRARILVRRPSP